MSAQLLLLENDVVRVGVRIADDGAAALEFLLPAGKEPQPYCTDKYPHALVPLIEIRLSGEANKVHKTGQAMVFGHIGDRLRYRSHRESSDARSRSKTLAIELHDEQSGVNATSNMTIYDGVSFLRSTVTIRNDGKEDIVLNQVPSIAIGGLTRSPKWWHDYDISYANNSWFREAQWLTRSLPDVGVDHIGIHSLPEECHASIACFGLSSQSSFSTNGKLPMGMLQRIDRTETWLWQIEHHGSWRWEIGDWNDNIYIAASGPTSQDHDWRQRLSPGAEFTTVPVSITHLVGEKKDADTEAAFAQLTRYRRRIRRKHADNRNLPIIFNDYMNCLMGDPTDEKILALIEPVARSGAEYFVIDAGWYADDSNWWDDVGLWEPSQKRFPMGFEKLLAKIWEAGLKPGLWIEPEVVGVRSVVAERLPRDAFFQRDGKRVLEKGRYQLDFRHPEVRKYLDSVVDRCVLQYGVGYFKFDYNIEVTQGTEVDRDGSAGSSGAGFLGHNRAYLQWLNGLFDRYPDLVIESCSSGAQRMDYSLLATQPLQSTSDQQWPDLYAAIAAAVPTAVTPEQSATWAYPQGSWSDETNAMTVVNSLLGRIHLSGRLDTMNAKQLKIVYDGMDVYRSIRGDIPNSTPFWPLGLPKWHDEWIALGLNAHNEEEREVGKYYVAVWRRGGSTKCKLPITPLRSVKGVELTFLYPTDFPAQYTWNEAESAIEVEVPDVDCARLYKLTKV